MPQGQRKEWIELTSRERPCWLDCRGSPLQDDTCTSECNITSNTTPQIAGPPPHHAVDSRDRAFLHDPGEERPMCGIELGRNARRRNVDETVRSLIIEPDHPVSQRLPIHPADSCRFGPRGSIEYRSDRQELALALRASLASPAGEPRRAAPQ